MSEMPNTIPLEELFEERASKEFIVESTAYQTVKTGTYVGQVVSAEGRERDGRAYVHLRVSISGKESGTKAGTVYMDASWVAKRTSTGKLDGMARRWGQLTKALFPSASVDTLSSKTVKDVLDAAVQYPVTLYVQEQFLIPREDDPTKNTYYTPRTPEEEKSCRERGYKPVNSVQSVTKA